MKTLLIFRHAKSSWKDHTLADHDRPLNKRGKRTAPRMGELISNEGVIPDLILSSTAKRARSTAKRAAKTMGYQGEMIYLESLYMAEPQAYLSAVRHHAEAQQRVMVIGHNPGLEEWVEMMTDMDHPTGALAEIRVAIESWHELAPDTSGRLRTSGCPYALR